MSKDNVIFKVVGGDEFEKYISSVSEHLKSDIDKSVETLGTKTKNVIKKNLVKHKHGKAKDHIEPGKGGVLSGKYKGSMKYENLNKGKAKEMSTIHFKVGATTPHYRLAHLLENGHKLVAWGRKTNKYTKSIPHISVGQQYAEDKVRDSFEKGIKNAFKKG